MPLARRCGWAALLAVLALASPAAAERQPVSRRDITPEITRANRMMAWGGFLFIMLVALVIGTYRKRVV